MLVVLENYLIFLSEPLTLPSVDADAWAEVSGMRRDVSVPVERSAISQVGNTVEISDAITSSNKEVVPATVTPDECENDMVSRPKFR